MVDETLRASNIKPRCLLVPLRYERLLRPKCRVIWQRFADIRWPAWVENTFGIDEQDGRLVRRMPIKFKEVGVEPTHESKRCVARVL